MASQPKKSVSIVDVAREAGVSTATVSRVLNNLDKVRPETREHVRKVAKRMEFTLAERRRGTSPKMESQRPTIRFLNFLNPAADASDINETFLLLKRGIVTAANAAGFSVSYHTVGPDDEMDFDPGEGATKGVILLGCRPPEEMENVLSKMPCCWAMAGSWGSDWGDQVMPDHQEVGRLAARYLLRKGHKTVVSLEAWPDERIHRFREAGFEHELKAEPEVQWTVIDGKQGCEGFGGFPSEYFIFEQLAKNLVNCSPRPTACFVDSDRVLFYVYPHLARLGFVPGRDFEVISCNCTKTYRQQLPFDFRSIDVHYELIGQMSVMQLLWRMKNPQVSTRVRSLVLPELHDHQVPD